MLGVARFNDHIGLDPLASCRVCVQFKQRYQASVPLCSLPSGQAGWYTRSSRALQPQGSASQPLGAMYSDLGRLSVRLAVVTVIKAFSDVWL